MDLDLLTIARKGNIGNRITGSYNTAKERLENFKVLINKTSSLSEFTDFEKEQNRIFALIGSVSIFENYINNLLFEILVSYPKKFGNKKFEIDELNEEGSLIALFEKKANQKILNLAYGKFEKFVNNFTKILDINNGLDEKKIQKVNEIKTSRDVYIHNDGKANELYFQKVDSCFERVNREGQLLPIDNDYVIDSIETIIDFIENIFNELPLPYKSLSHRRVFKIMWEKTCLNKRVPFDKAWKVIDEENFHIADRETDYGFSHSEVEVYNMFKDIYLGANRTDFGYLLKRWHPSTNEHKIALSWLNSPFYL